MSDAPTLPDAGGTEGGMTESGSDGGGVPLLSCTVTPNTITKLADLPSGDAGVSFEALLIVPFDDGSHASIIAITRPTSNSAATLNVWTLDTSNNGTPNPIAPQPIQTQNGVRWIGRLTGSIGLLSCDQIGNNWGLTLTRLKQSDLNQQGGPVSLSDTLRAEPGTNPTLTNCHDGALLELSPGNYFTVVNVTDQQNTSAAMLAGALKTSGSVAKFGALGEEAHVFDSIFNLGGTIHSIAVTGQAFPAVVPHDYMFDAMSADSKGVKDLQNMGLVAGRSMANGKIAALYVDLGANVNVRVGTVPDLEPASAMALPITGLTTGELPLNAGSVRWTSSMTAPQLLGAGPTTSGTGVNFLWYDADGAAHGRQTKMGTLLPMVNNIQAADVTSVVPPSASFGQFPLTWATQDPQTKATSVYYGRVVCTQ